MDWIDGGVTAPRGFRAAGTYCGIKRYGPEPRLDLGLLASVQPAVAAGLFTRNRITGAPVQLSRHHLAGGRAQAIIANSGCSNVATGDGGLADARRMAELAAAALGIGAGDVVVASTGVIGRRLPMDALEAGVGRLAVDEQGGEAFARAIMTTDTVAKSRALRVRGEDRSYVLGAAAKGAGMVHPNMATMLCFVTSDAPLQPDWLRQTLREVADRTLNMLDVDTDTSTSDMLVVLANGLAGGTPIGTGHAAAGAFREGLEALLLQLTRDLARDGEGARTLIEVRVRGAADLADARAAARTVVSSPLVKTMVTGRDANAGRVLMAVGRSGARLEPDKIAVWVGAHQVVASGCATDAQAEQIARAMDRDEVTITVDLGLGDAGATAWGCDLTEEYIRINADYTT